MTSLIFGSIYMGHKGIVNHRREKQRVKNYQRWEGLRDEYDEQRKISRESRSLDIQRTGQDYTSSDQPILTLRDQQEANDARTSWRPQESFEEAPRRTSVEVTTGSGLRPLVADRTGAWDAGLPQPLKVTRRNFDDYDSAVSRSSSLRHASSPNPPSQDRSASNTPSVSNNASPRPDALAPAGHMSHPHAARAVSSPVETMHHHHVEPLQHANPGGMMAELIDAGHQPHRPAPYTHQQPQTFAGYAPQNYYPPAPAPQQPQQPHDGSMQEWWNRP